MASEPDDSGDDKHYNALPIGYRLHEYRLDKVLGVGGFGITYLAWDTNLAKRVAIKEYLPAEFAVRVGEVTVQAKSAADRDDYRWGLERFMEEAQMLARFQHKNIVQVFRFFEAHGTAYMVMNYEEGESFADIVRRERSGFDEAGLLDLVLPLLDGLKEVHAAKVLHRDIKPGNIYIRDDGSPVLLDFGAARDQIGRKSRGLTSIVTPGYAPLEQYHTDGNQGPWTDIYAMGAILYQAVSGNLPPEAPARIRNDPLTGAAEIGRGRYSESFLQAIDWALAVDEDARPQTVQEWRDALIGARRQATAGAQTMVAGRPLPGDVATRPAKGKDRPRRGARMAAAAAGVALVAALAGGGWLYMEQRGGEQGSTESGQRAEAPTAEEPGAPGEESQGESERAPEQAAAEQAPAERTPAEQAPADEKPAEAPPAEQPATESPPQQPPVEAQPKPSEPELAQPEEPAVTPPAKEEPPSQAAEQPPASGGSGPNVSTGPVPRPEPPPAAARRPDPTPASRPRESSPPPQTAAKPEQTPSSRLIACGWLLPGLNARVPVRDCSAVSGLVNFVLENNRTGEGGSWRSRDNRYSGTVVPVQTFERPDGIPCRRFSQSIVIDGKTRHAEGTACRMRDRPEWRLVL